MTFCGDKVGLNDTNRNTVFLSEWFKNGHFLLIINLNDGCSFENKSIFINGSGFVCHSIESICLFDDRYRLSCKSTFIDKCATLKNDPFKGNFDCFFKENNISWNSINWWNLFYFSLSQDVDFNFIVSHIEDFAVQIHDLDEVDNQTDWWNNKEAQCKKIVLNVECPIKNTEYEENVKRTKDLSHSNIHTAWLLHNHCAFTIGIL